MSRTFHDKDTNAWLREVVKDYSKAGVGVDLLLHVGSHDHSDDFDTANVAITNDSPVWDLSTNVARYLDLRQVRRAPVRVRADFDGVLIDVFEGREDGLARPEEDYSTSFLATTPGSWLSKIPLGEPVEYDRRSPRWILRDAISRSPYYDRGNIFIHPFDTPQITRKKGDRFEDDTYPADIIEDVRQMVAFSFKDLPTRYGCRVRPEIGTGEGQPIEWVFDAHDDREIVERWVEPAPVAPEDQPTTVIAREYYDNGSIKIWEEARVFQYGDKYPSPGIPKFIDFSTEDLNAEGIRNSARDANLAAREEARRYRSLQHGGSVTTVFNPFLVPDDVVTFTSRIEITNRGYFRRVWRAVIEGVSHDWSAPSLSSIFDFRSFLLSEIRLPDPPIRLPGVTAAIADFKNVTPLISYADKEIIFAPNTSWVTFSEHEAIFSQEAPVVIEDKEVLVNP